MNLEEIAWHLSDVLEHASAIYLRCEPDVLDFTNSNMTGKLHVESERKKVSIDVSADNIRDVFGLLDVTIFDKDLLKLLVCWDFKSLLSFFHFTVKKHVTPTVNLIDLKPIENFLNVRKPMPKNWIEALNRVKLASQQPAWKQVYKAVHQPLTMRVLPSLETTALLNEDTKQSVYAHYEIEGQTNGRMNNFKRFEKSYLPFTMGPDLKKALRPESPTLRFVGADFQACEVAVLQWLSKDPVLGQILEQGLDPHRAIYERLTGDACDNPNKRRMSKGIFLPVMFGLGPNTLSKNLNLPESVAGELVRRVRQEFPDCWEFMYRNEKTAGEQGRFSDHFGRPRTFEPGKEYLVRNLVVQAVAATVCLEKLIALYKGVDAAKLRLTVHDGYALTCEVPSAKDAYDQIKGVLESESKLCPGLKMKAEIKFGAKLDAMKVLWND